MFDHVCARSELERVSGPRPKSASTQQDSEQAPPSPSSSERQTGAARTNSSDSDSDISFDADFDTTGFRLATDPAQRVLKATTVPLSTPRGVKVVPTGGESDRPRYLGF